VRDCLLDAVDFLADAVDFLADAVDFLRDAVDFLRDAVDFLRDAVDFLRDAVDFLRDAVDFLREPVDCLREGEDEAFLRRPLRAALFLRPPSSCLFTVAQARRAAVFALTPRSSIDSSMWRALRFCLSV